MVGHVERFNPAIIKLKELIKRRRFGKIINLLTMRVGINPPSILDSDVALDLAVHDIDVFNYLLNRYPTTSKIVKNKIFKTNIADSASILLEYENIVGMIQTNWLTPVKIRKLYVTGTDGFAEVDFINQEIVVYNKHLKTRRDGDFFEFVSLHAFPKKEVYISKKEPLREELRFFLQAVRGEKKTSPVHALEALKILLNQ
jgi:UDP-N-acetylglucosamine 3-dehydrogenase